MGDKKKLAISFLAYGNKHIDELSNLLNKLGEYKNEINFYITTDTEFNLYNYNKIILPFNYNLKRFPIRDAFINNDVVLFIDTDHVLKKKI